MTTSSDNLTALLDQMSDAGEGDQHKVTVGELIDQFGSQGTGVVIVLLSLVALGPTGAIPGASVVSGFLIIVFSVHLLVGGGKPWIPKRIEEARIPRDKVEKTAGMFKLPAKYIDYLVTSRMEALFKMPLSLIPPVLLIVLALTYFPLALVPFGVALPSSATAMIALGMCFRDGLFLLAGYAVALAVPVVAMVAIG